MATPINSYRGKYRPSVKTLKISLCPYTIIKPQAVAALVAVMVVLLTLSRGTYARGDSASAEVGNVYNLE